MRPWAPRSSSHDASPLNRMTHPGIIEESFLSLTLSDGLGAAGGRGGACVRGGVKDPARLSASISDTARGAATPDAVRIWGIRSRPLEASSSPNQKFF